MNAPDVWTLAWQILVSTGAVLLVAGLGWAFYDWRVMRKQARKAAKAARHE